MASSEQPEETTLPEGAMETLEEATRGAGAILLSHRGKLRAIEFKSEIDLVTEADRNSEAFIVNLLQRRFPDHAILAEESGALAGAGKGVAAGEPAEWRWVIDPLDGTTNYAHGLPIFCVTIALQHRGSTVAGTVLAPVLGEYYTAWLGGGAWLNGERIHVSPTSELSKSLTVTGFPYDRRTNVEHYMRIFGRILSRTRGVLRWGSAAYDLANVASGRLEAFWEEKLHPWDTVAGDLLVREAGGRVSAFDGSAYSIFDPSMLATNGAIHEGMMRLIAEANSPDS
jgi:myo-inositol-1(or 4)-monophosphatase